MSKGSASHRINDRCKYLLENENFHPGLLYNLFPSGIANTEKGVLDDIYSSIMYFRKLYEDNIIPLETDLIIKPYYNSDIYIVELYPDLYASRLYTFDGYEVVHEEIENILDSCLKIHSTIDWTNYDGACIAVQFTPSPFFGRNFIHEDFAQNFSWNDFHYDICEVHNNKMYYDTYNIIKNSQAYVDYCQFRESNMELISMLQVYDLRELISFNNIWHSDKGCLRLNIEDDFNINKFVNYFETSLDSLNIKVKPLELICCYQKEPFDIDYNNEILTAFETLVDKNDPYLVLDISSIIRFDSSLELAYNFFKETYKSVDDCQGVLIAPTIKLDSALAQGFRIRFVDYIYLTNGFDASNKVNHLSMIKNLRTIADINMQIEGIRSGFNYYKLYKRQENSNNLDIHYESLLRSYYKGITKLGNHYKI